MNKSDLIRATRSIVFQSIDGTTIKDTEIFIEAALKVIQNALANGENVHLVGFGNFEVVERNERIGRNPKTGEEAVIPASKTVKFKVGKNLKAIVNNGIAKEVSE